MRRIKIDFDNPGLPKRLDVMENDAQSRFFEAELYQGGKAYSAPSGATYSIMYHGFGPQNEGWYDTINDGAGKRAACTVSGNVVTCELARQALRVPGHMTVILCVTDPTGYMLKGWPITANVRNDEYNDGEEVEMYFNLSSSVSNSIDQLKKAIADAEQAQKDIETKAAEALASIPEDYTELDANVKQLKEDLGNIPISYEVGVNKYDGESIHDTNIDKTNGLIISYAGSSSTNFIAVKPNTKYELFAFYSDISKLCVPYISCIYAYDMNKNSIAAIGVASYSEDLSSENGKFTTTEETYYIKFSSSTSVFEKNKIQISEYKGKIPKYVQDFIKSTILTGSNYISYSDFKEKILYFSENGDDDSNGLTPEFPKKDPSKYLTHGDCTILLKGGDIFHIGHTSLGNNLTISSYGSGRAIISGYYKNPNAFVDNGDGTFTANIENVRIPFISINGKETWKLKILSDIKDDGDFKIDKKSKTLTLKSNQNLNGNYFYCATGGSLFKIKDGNNIVIENIEVTAYGSLLVAFKANNLLVKKCYIHHCGGAFLDEDVNSVVKSGGGITVALNGSHDCYILNNKIDYTFDCGLSAQIWDGGETVGADSYNIFFCNNEVTRCYYGIEIFASPKTQNKHHVVFSNNYISDHYDVSEGSRAGIPSADVSFPSLFMCWKMNGNNDIHIKDNTFIKSNNGYAIVISEKVEGNMLFENNVFSASNNKNVSYINEANKWFNESVIVLDDIKNSDTQKSKFLYYEGLAKRNLQYEYLIPISKYNYSTR